MLSPFMPTLLEIAILEMAVDFFNDFGLSICEKVFMEIERQNSPKPCKYRKKNAQTNYEKAKKRALGIPVCLAKRFLETIYGLNSTIHQWHQDHSIFYRSPKAAIAFYWRSDGTIDRTETAQQLISNESMCIKERFELACMYCWEDNIRSLFSEMKMYGDSMADWDFKFNSIESFWIKRMSQNESQVDWMRALLEELGSSNDVVPIFSSFLPSLQSADRQKCLNFLIHTNTDDLRMCLYTMTNEEKEDFLMKYTPAVLRLYLQWPLQNFFMDIAEKTWSYLTYDDFFIVWIDFDFQRKLQKQIRTNFDYGALFVEFWNRSPIQLRESLSLEERNEMFSFLKKEERQKLLL